MSKHECSSCTHKSKDVYNTSKHAAIVLMTTTNHGSRSRIHFDSGIAIRGPSQRFDISSNGTTITFKVSGLYEVQFQGVVSAKTNVNLQFVKTPELPRNKLPFSKFKVSSGMVSASTVLPFARGDALEVILRGEDRSYVNIDSTCKLLIVRVDDM